MSVVDPRPLFDACLGALRGCVAELSDTDLTRPTACRGWHVADLVTHLRLGADEVLRGLASTTNNPADRDALSYWSDWPAKGAPSFADVRWLWAQSAAYSHGGELRSHFEDSARAAQSAGARAPAGRIEFQSHVMTIDDFLATWVVEFTVHHLDLVRYLDAQPSPDPGALRFTVVSLEALTATRQPRDWNDHTFLRKATGREALDSADLRQLGDHADRFPAFG